MENETLLKEVLHALKLHRDHIDKKIDEKIDAKIDGVKNEVSGLKTELNQRMDKLENKMDTGFDRLGKKFAGARVESTETQETVDYLSSKTIQHEKKIRQLQNQA